MIRRLRIKFIFINMLIALVLLSVIFSMVLHFTRLNMEQESIQRMRTILSSRFQPAPPNTLPDVPPNLPAREPGLPYFIVHQPPQGQITTIESRGNYEDLSSEFLSELLEAVSLEKAVLSLNTSFDFTVVLLTHDLLYLQIFPANRHCSKVCSNPVFLLVVSALLPCF